MAGNREEWIGLSDIGFPDYSVSSWGRICNDNTGRMVQASVNTTGIMKVALVRPRDFKGERRIHLSLTKIVAEHFVPGRTDICTTPIHLDGNKTHTHADNLAWRPRYFAVWFHRQFEEPTKYGPDYHVQEMASGEQFDTIRQAAIFYGILEDDIYLSTANPPGRYHCRFTGQDFEYLTE